MTLIKNQRSAKRRKIWKDFISRLPKYLTIDYVKYLVFDPNALSNGVISALIILAELVINVAVINRVPYTEIDWKAYMQECEGFINGTMNYALLRGDTGPLVYPGGFVYIFTVLYYITSHGVNIRLAQYIFAGIYLLQMWLVLRLYSLSKKVPPYVLVIMAFTSYRVHSIYVLRLFNDPVAVLLLYAALNLFVEHHWCWGSLLYSFAVGIKMNILLFAPALLLFYIVNLGYVWTAYQLALCAFVQVMLGAPFLLSYPLAYLKGSFDLGRVFEHQWTVNYRFLAKYYFEHKYFHISLLVAHLTLLLIFLKPALQFFCNYVRLRELQTQLAPQLERHNRQLQHQAAQRLPKPIRASLAEPTFNALEQTFINGFEQTLKKSTAKKQSMQTAPTDGRTDNSVDICFDHCIQLALLPFFICNFIGMACARSLHYQFYIWYYHSLPYLLWSTPYSFVARLTVWGLLEYAWNTYPSTAVSSGLLHMCHLLVIYGVGRHMYRTLSNAKTNRTD